MPVSSPSYFPPAGGGGQIVGTTAGNGATGVRTFLAGANAAKFTQQSDIIVVGHNAFSANTVGAPSSDVNLAGLIVIGSGAAAAVTQTVGGGFGQGTSLIIGFNALPVDTQTNFNVLLGPNVLQHYVSNAGNPQAANVIIGESAGAFVNAPNSGSGVGYASNVVIGWRAGSAVQSGLTQKSVAHNVIIGSVAVNKILGSGATGGPGLSQNVVIGETAGSNFGGVDSVAGCVANVAIGFGAGASDVGSAGGNVLIGFGATASAGGTRPTRNVAIGSTLSGGNGVVGGVDRNVVIGAEAANASTNNLCILIGAGCGNQGGNSIAVLDSQFLVETFDAVTRKNLLYGILSAASPGGLIVGFSTPGTNRDVPGFNILKLLNGSVTGVAPVGGGFFYSLAGRLHWVDTGNVDWVLTGTAAGQLASSLTGFTNNAAAAAGTLTNAPVAGNPTRWIPINDNGTIRNVPAW